MSNSAAGGRAPLGLFPGQPAPRLYDRVVEALRSRHYSRRTEEAYLHPRISAFVSDPFIGGRLRYPVQELLGHKDVQTTMVCVPRMPVTRCDRVVELKAGRIETSNRPSNMPLQPTSGAVRG